jgi:hypothetical protein
MGYRNEISNNLYETEQGLFWKGNLYQPANINNITKILENVSLTDAANVELLPAVANGKKFYLTKLDFVPEKIIGLASILGVFQTPIISVGFAAPTFNSLIASLDLSVLNNEDTFYPMVLNGATPVVPINTALVMKKIRVASATEYKLSIRILGYYR